MSGTDAAGAPTDEGAKALEVERLAREEARVGQAVRGLGPEHVSPEDVSFEDEQAATRPDQLAPHLADAEDGQEALRDEGLEETPASDPFSAKRTT